jgi:hypothetical protein
MGMEGWTQWMCCIVAAARRASTRDVEEGCGSVSWLPTPRTTTSRRGEEEDEVVVEHGVGLLS